MGHPTVAVVSLDTDLPGSIAVSILYLFISNVALLPGKC
jgi:hypothetical protein